MIARLLQGPSRAVRHWPPCSRQVGGLLLQRDWRRAGRVPQTPRTTVLKAVPQTSSLAWFARVSCAWPAHWRTVVLARRSVVVALGTALSIAAVSSAAHAQDKAITVFAAASMKNALDDVDATYTKQSGVKVVASYDASSALMKQIEGGAPADVFVSADLKWMDYGSQKKLINDSTKVNLLGNELVLIAPKDSKIGNVTIKPGFHLP